MKIGLTTIYNVPNYGSVLQTYATQELLKSLGHDVEVIQYDYFNERYYNERGYGATWRERFYPLKALMLPWCRAAALKRFRNKYLNFTKPFGSLEALSDNDWSGYDAFVVGSDQVWNTKFLLGDPGFLLQYVPNNKPRISLSSSFATKSVNDKYEDLFKRELSKFSSLSVREINGVDIIQRQLGIDKPVEVTLDPTLLLSKEQWLSKFTVNKRKHDKPYILYYMLPYAFEPRPYIYEVVKYFKDSLDYDVVALEGIRDSSDCKDVAFADADNSTIPEFIDLFSNASLVITSSFHGTAFALNFGKPLISVVPDNAGDDRQTTLLKNCGATSSIVKIGTPIYTINPNYDNTAVSSKLNAMREQSIKWIKNNINDTKKSK